MAMAKFAQVGNRYVNLDAITYITRIGSEDDTSVIVRYIGNDTLTLEGDDARRLLDALKGHVKASGSF